MTVYWLLFIIPALISLAPYAFQGQVRPHSRDALPWLIAGLILILAIGLRHEVGGDWLSYTMHVDYAKAAPILEVIEDQKDPAYSALNWIGANVFGDVYFVNVVCAAIFSWGLLAFCRAQSRPWLALSVAMPYLVIVVGMGYTRQSVALGLTMMSFVSLQKEHIWRFLFFVACATLFHKSAIVVVPLAVFSAGKNKWLVLPAMATSCAVLFVMLIKESIDLLVENYLGAAYASSGALVRILMNAVPATLFLLGRKRLALPLTTDRFWTWMAWTALAFIVLLEASPSSTAVDRLALYWIPIQVFAWSRLPDFLRIKGVHDLVWVICVLSYSALALYVWLVYAENSFSWLPYQFYLLEQV